MQIEDHSGDRANFTIIPNSLFDLGLSPYAFALYLFVKRVCGQSTTGCCNILIVNIAAALSCPKSEVVRGSQELVNAGMIEITEDGMRALQ